MKKVIFVLMFIAMSAFTMSAQVRFAANADVYRDSDNRKVGTQYIAANIGYDGYGTVTLGNMTLNAQVKKTHRDNTYKMTAYSVALYSQRGKSVDIVITKRDSGSCTVLVYYADGTLRYDFRL
jgi:hypothetical protein